jgi:CBS-domain-containing membrane protein
LADDNIQDVATASNISPSGKTMGYPSKMSGTLRNHKGVFIAELLLAWLGGFFGITVLGYVHFNVPEHPDALMLITAFGSSAVLVFGDSESPSAQPRSLIGGHLLSALVGVLSYRILHNQPLTAAAVATATSIVVMRLTMTLHPPGGATALLAVIGTDEIHNLGFFYVVAPVGIGAAVLLSLGLIINNIRGSRRYPKSWFS